MAFKTVGTKPQTALLLDHLKSRSSISSLEAWAIYRIRSLSRRINDLEAKGHVFARDTRSDPTGQRYVRYHYLGLRPHVIAGTSAAAGSAHAA